MNERRKLFAIWPVQQVSAASNLMLIQHERNDKTGKNDNVLNLTRNFRLLWSRNLT